jgi:hypothetical protein
VFGVLYTCVCVCVSVCDPIIREKILRTAVSWVITHRVVVIYYRRFATTYRSHTQGSKTFRHNISVPSSGCEDGNDRLFRNVSKKLRLLAATLRMEPIGCPETSVRNHHYSLRNNPEEHSSQVLGGGSLKSSTEKNSIFFSLFKDSFSTRFRDLSGII